MLSGSNHDGANEASARGPRGPRVRLKVCCAGLRRLSAFEFGGAAEDEDGNSMDPAPAHFSSTPTMFCSRYRLRPSLRQNRKHTLAEIAREGLWLGHDIGQDQF